MERRLAAILSADVVGYSRLMDADEVGTHDALRAHRTELVEPLIAKFHGRVVKLTGDGGLAEFASAVDAVQCACAIQRGMQERNRAIPEDRQIRFRIGINVGDIILEAEDIYGAGVNIAARLQELAPPDGICVSKTVVDYVKSLADLDFEYVGERRVKNIAEPLAVFRVEPTTASRRARRVLRRPRLRHRRQQAAAALAALLLVAVAAIGGWLLWPRPPAGPALPEEPSVAVLPFENFGPDQSQTYLANGITEDLITNLAKVPDLFVIARQSSFAYRDKPVSLQQIAAELGVHYVVEGSIQRSKESIRVTAQLVDALSGRHLWAERYERPLGGLFDIQDSVTSAVAGTMIGTTGVLAEAELSRLSQKNPKNFGAYDYLMRGWDKWYEFTKPSNEEARRLFQTALQLDPEYARAYAGIAWTHALAYEYDWTDEYDAAVAQAMTLAKTAVNLDDRDYRNYWILGWSHLYSWEHDLALANYDRARELNPNDAELMAEMASLLIYIGRPEQAIAQLQEAMRRNPMHDSWYVEYLGWAFEEAGMPQACIETLETVIDPVPTQEQLWLLRTIAACYAHPEVDRMDEAERVAVEILRLDPDFSMAEHKAYVEEVFPYESQALIDRWIEAFSRVGLPE